MCKPPMASTNFSKSNPYRAPRRLKGPNSSFMLGAEQCSCGPKVTVNFSMLSPATLDESRKVCDYEGRITVLYRALGECLTFRRLAAAPGGEHDDVAKAKIEPMSEIWDPIHATHVVRSYAVQKSKAQDYEDGYFIPSTIFHTTEGFARKIKNQGSPQDWKAAGGKAVHDIIFPEHEHHESPIQQMENQSLNDANQGLCDGHQKSYVDYASSSPAVTPALPGSHPHQGPGAIASRAHSRPVYLRAGTFQPARMLQVGSARDPWH
jgi:hypothetical protein